MQFRRNGQRDERRRRALMDDRAGESGKQQATEDNASPGRLSTRTYSKSAVDERRVRVIDVVPVYAVHVVLFYAAVLIVTAGLLALDYYGSHALRWADLSRVDSLGTYLTAGTLFAGVLLAGLIYRIRRHRLDDYRGRYRCWLWFAALLLLASMDSMLNFRSDVAIGLEAATKLRFFGQTGGWWAIVWCFGFGAMALRGAIEVRESIGTLLVATLSGILLLAGVALELDLVLLPATVPGELVLHAVRLVGVGLLLASLVQYARYVWLDAQGLIARSGRLPIKSEEEEVAAKPKPRRSRTAAKKAAAKVAEEADELEEEAQPRRSWFGFGRKKVVEEEAEEEATKPAAAKSRKAPPAEEEEPTEVKPKRAWFSLSRKRAAEAETEEESSPPAPAKSRGSRSQAEEEPAEEKPRRGWFSFGRKSSDVESAEEPVKPAKSKPAPAKPKIAAETTGDSEEATEAPPKKSWFSWGSKKEEAETEAQDEAAAEQSRTTMSPRIKTRPKAATPPKEEPQPEPEPKREPPTITGKYNKLPEAEENSVEDEEILRLESKPDHLLSKAERRRLKKLKRRAAA
ncbi:DNA-directed RNA polymerase I subunit RPA34 [Blastopirellula marina]|uniref:Uncharacterized protein n=1 Tax=Blastopirellula marina TaxID=124 RepID=A0A2S8GNU5_9BACT|nr:hypothetical protein [Blastopirellula marina]PQO46116.1 hypothetical protein C5Y93_11115 [Blastopirellula marina]